MAHPDDVAVTVALKTLPAVEARITEQPSARVAPTPLKATPGLKQGGEGHRLWVRWGRRWWRDWRW